MTVEFKVNTLKNPNSIYGYKDGEALLLKDYGRKALRHTNPSDAYDPPANMHFDPVNLTCSKGYNRTLTAGNVHRYTPLTPEQEEHFQDNRKTRERTDVHVPRSNEKITKLFNNAIKSFQGDAMNIYGIQKELRQLGPVISDIRKDNGNVSYIYFPLLIWRYYQVVSLVLIPVCSLTRQTHKPQRRNCASTLKVLNCVTVESTRRQR